MIKNVQFENISDKLKVSTVYSDIEINDTNPAKNWNWARTQPWCTQGSGTLKEPYIIEDEAFNYSIGMGNCLQILNSRKYFIIRNCTIADSNPSWLGIYLYNVTNGQILNNNIFNNGIGGIGVHNSNDTIISNNQIRNNGDWGIFSIEYSSNNTIRGNTIEGHANDGIRLHNCFDQILMENTIFNNSESGIRLIDSKYNNLSGNIGYDNIISGIRLDSSQNNTIHMNTVYNNQDGIILMMSRYNTLLGNSIRDNIGNGLYLGSESRDSLTSQNYFLRNGKHAEDWGTDNKWNCTIIGNYWDNHTTPDANDDGIVDDPYTNIGGVPGSTDYLPIAEDGAPRIKINSPSSGDLFSLTAPSFDVEITEDYLDTMWYTLDGGSNNYTFTENGIINQSAWDCMDDGPITLTFYARDIPGYIGSAEVDIIKDIVAPRIEIYSPSTGDTFGTSAPTFNVEITDDQLASMWYTIDGGLHNYTFTTNNTINQTAWDERDDGAITLTFYASDIPGYIGSAEVDIIKDTVAPIIVINSPTEGEKFGKNAPLFNITVTDDNLGVLWYSFDGGAHIYVITNNSVFNQTAWIELSEGDVTITFYARDLAGNEASESVTVIKSVPSGLDPGVIITIVVVSLVGGVAIVVVLYIILKKRKAGA